MSAADAGSLDRVLGGPLAVLVVLSLGWLLICGWAAHRRAPGRPVAGDGLVGGVGGTGGAGTARQVVRAAVAFVGAAGLLSQVDGAAAAPADTTATAVSPVSVSPVGVSPVVVSAVGVSAVGGSGLAGVLVGDGRLVGDEVSGVRGGPADPLPPVTLSVVTDGGEKVPSLWPVGREDTREQLAPVPGDRVVVVHRGDSLWSMARRHLEPEVGQAAIMQAVHDWYVLNESVIGPDRDLILPGQELHVPGARPRLEVTDST